MKIMKEGKVLGVWNPLSVLGFWINAIGLTAFFLIGYQLVDKLLHGPVVAASIEILSVELLVACLVILTGFGMMVAGADPFDDANEEFQTRE